jgi:hypothetical protein
MQKIDTVSSDSNSDYRLQGTIIFLDNDDVIVVVTGGRDHIGAISLAVPQPSLFDQNRLSAESSVLTMLGHKEDELVKYVSEKIASTTGRNVVVIAGVHYDGLARDDLEIVRKQWVVLTEKIIIHINQ